MRIKSDARHTDKTQKTQRMFSLKRQIVVSVWLFLIVVASLLLLFLFSMISSFQRKEDERRTADLLYYAETLDTNLSQLKDSVGEIYWQNNNFDGLNVYPSTAKKWDHLYDLLNVMRVQVKSNRGISGLFLFYDSFDSVQYILNDNVGFDSNQELKHAGKNNLKSIDETYMSFPLMTEEDSWYSIYMKKNTAAIGGCIDLAQGLPDDKDRNAVYGVIINGRIYSIWEDDNEINLKENDTLNKENIQGTYVSNTPEDNNVTGNETVEKSVEESPNRQRVGRTLLDSLYINQLLPGKNHIDGKVVYVRQLNSDNISVIEILPESIWLYINQTHIALILLLILYVYAAFRIRNFVYSQLSRPLEDMVKAMKNIRSGDWEVQFTAPNRISEIEDVRQAVKTLVGEIEQYKIRFYEEELGKARIYRQYLQLQLAPHFYTNCLKNAYYMLELKEYDNAELFLQKLSVHMRYLLQKDAGFVTLEKEIDFLKNYVDLQKLMTAKPLMCKISADSDVMDKEVPILTLQTFVENSVKYGRNDNGDQLTINVQVILRKTEEGNYLDITVRDNGRGYPEELLDVINGDNPPEKEKDGLGIGILNLQNRIRLFYGENASWYFENQGGAVSELILPERVGRQS